MGGRGACAYIAFALGLLLGSASNANADACWDYWRPKVQRLGNEAFRYEALLKKTGDCSYVEKIVAATGRFAAMGRQIPCANMQLNYPCLGDCLRRTYQKYCKKEREREAQKSSSGPRPVAAEAANGRPAYCDPSGKCTPAPSVAPPKPPPSQSVLARAAL
jgi:hypothetical protein